MPQKPVSDWTRPQNTYLTSAEKFSTQVCYFYSQFCWYSCNIWKTSNCWLIGWILRFLALLLPLSPRWRWSFPKLKYITITFSLTEYSKIFLSCSFYPQLKKMLKARTGVLHIFSQIKVAHIAFWLLRGFAENIMSFFRQMGTLMPQRPRLMPGRFFLLIYVE